MSAPLSILCAILDFGRFREVEAFLMEVSELTSLGMFTLTRVPPVLRVVRSTVLHHVLVRGWTSGGCRCHRSTGAVAQLNYWVLHFTIVQFYRALLQGLGCQEQIPAGDQMDSTTCGRHLVHPVSIARVMFIHS